MKHCDKKAVTINPTNKCNLRCIYCMASSGEEQNNPIKISIDFAKRGIEDALKGYPTNISADILRFFAPGEPTQAMDVIMECVNFARAIKPDILTELQTNGLFETSEDTEWIRDNFSFVWFSLDGPCNINKKNRPDINGQDRTTEIEQNMKIVAEKATVGVRPTIVEETMDYQAEIVAYFGNMGVKNIATNPVIYPIQRQDTGKKIVTNGNIMRFARGFIRAFKQAERLGVSLTSSLTFNFDEPTNIACRSCIPMPQLNPDGTLSSCDMALYGDTKKELQCFLYGRWDHKEKKIIYDEKKIEYLRSRRLENLPLCSDCKYGKYCAGGCAGRAAFQTGDIFTTIPAYCAATKFLAKELYYSLGINSISNEATHP